MAEQNTGAAQPAAAGDSGAANNAVAGDGVFDESNIPGLLEDNVDEATRNLLNKDDDPKPDEDDDPKPDEDDDPKPDEDDDPKPGEDDDPKPGEDDDPKPGEDDEDHLGEDLKKKLPEEFQESINRRIGKEVGKRKELEEKNAELEEKLVEADARAEAGDQAVRGELAQTLGVHELMVAQSEGDIDAWLAKYDEFSDWADKYDESGFVGDGSEDNPQFSAKDVQLRMKQLKRDYDRVLPKARVRLSKRLDVENKILKKVYPDLADKRSDAFKEMQLFLKQVPGLSALPDGKLIAADYIAGRRLRRGKAAAPVQRKAAAKAPQLATKPGAGKKSSVAGRTKTRNINADAAATGFSDEGIAGVLDY